MSNWYFSVLKQFPVMLQHILQQLAECRMNIWPLMNLSEYRSKVSVFPCPTLKYDIDLPFLKWKRTACYVCCTSSKYLSISAVVQKGPLRTMITYIDT